MELTVVVAILGILASISIPSITKWLKLAKIDEAKSLVNSSLAECIQSFRDGNLPVNSSPPDTVISNDRLSPASYKIKNSDTNCASFRVTPISETDDILYEFGFTISSEGKVTKIAIPAEGSFESLPSCKRWAGVNCGLSPERAKELQDEKDRQARESKCRKDLNDWKATISNQKYGVGTGWNSNTSSCDKPIYLCKGAEKSKENYDLCVEEVDGAPCNEARSSAKTQKFTGEPQDFNSTFGNVCSQPSYYCQGDELSTKAAYDTCLSNNKQASCKKHRSDQVTESINNSNYPPNGKWEPNVAKPWVDECGKDVWICRGDSHESEQAYKDNEDCFPPTPPCAPKPGTETAWCGASGAWWDHPICDSFNERCNYSR